MGARESVQRLIDRKSQEITDLEKQIEMAQVYLQALQDSMKALPRETPSNGDGNGVPALRPGTLLAKAQDAILRHGKPMYIEDILESIGMENTKAARVSLIGSLGNYVRKQVIFTRPGPNIFGLVGMPLASADLPEGFGEIMEQNRPRATSGPPEGNAGS